MQIVVDGLITEYKKSGKGPVMLFLHGWGDTLKTFDRLVVGFEDKHTCLRVDLPGFGGTEVPTGAWTLTDYATFVQTFLAKLEVKELDVVVGHSNGGAIAVKALSTRQLAANKLVLLSASGIRPKKTIKTTIITLGAKVGKHAAKFLPKANQRALRKAVYNKLGSDYLAAPQMAETFKKVVREDVRTGLSNVTIPTLLIYGETDNDTPLWIAKTFLSKLPDAKLHVAPLAGHFVHHDAMADTTKAMKEFVG